MITKKTAKYSPDTTSQKSIRMVHISDLAEWIESERAKA
ncbi:pyocin activator PrtN family protein [Morganella morganii subsp. sibonii]